MALLPFTEVRQFGSEMRVMSRPSESKYGDRVMDLTRTTRAMADCAPILAAQLLLISAATAPATTTDE